jgi:hypothetical protein
VARLLLPQGATLKVVAPDVGREADVRLEDAFTTPSLSMAGKSAWCRRSRGVCTAESANWRASTPAALSELEQTRASQRATHLDRQCLESFDRDLQRKDQALGETAPLPVLSKGSQRHDFASGGFNAMDSVGRMSPKGRYAKLSIATPMRSSQLCVDRRPWGRL